MDIQPPLQAGSRARAYLVVVLIALAAILARLAVLEWTCGAAFREHAARPLKRQETLPVSRGRISTVDGVVLADDQLLRVVSVRFRYLETPPDPAWLRERILARLPARQRKDAPRIAQEESRFRAELADLHRRLAAICGISDDEWRSRTMRIQRRVARIAESVNRRHAGASSPPPQRIVVAEECAVHPVFSGLPEEAARRIAAEPERFPGVQIQECPARVYPRATLAAHIVGHLGEVGPNAVDKKAALRPGMRVGRVGIERQLEHILRGHPGVILRTTDHKGRVLTEETLHAPVPGCDVRLTLRAGLQDAAERLLDDALSRRDAIYQTGGGGAIVVLNVQTGAILAAASAPRFDPNVFERADSKAIRTLTRSTDAPMFNRAMRMKLPPGSVFKIVTAVALLEEGVVEAETPFECRGYLDDPAAFRCAIFIRHGVGHGTIDLHDSLARSCNAFFFHHAEALGSTALSDWAGRFGLGRDTGIDLPTESRGRIGESAKRPSLCLAAIGQGPVTATPMQIARMTAAIANGGRLVVPHVVASDSPGAASDTRLVSQPIPDLSSNTLDTIHDAMRMVVMDPKGTAYAFLRDAAVPLCAKTGTAQTDNGPSHAWLAAYFPANAPRYAAVVAIEHAGGGAEAAGPVMERLVGVIAGEESEIGH